MLTNWTSKIVKLGKNQYQFLKVIGKETYYMILKNGISSYIIRKHQHGSMKVWVCNCNSYFFRQKCKHVKALKNFR